MPRLTRLPSVPFGWYYVMLQSVKGRALVTSKAELVTELNVLRATLRSRGARLHAAYLAEHELHLALQAGEGPLNGITASFAHEYARRFNRAHGECGSLFRPHHHVLLFQQQCWLLPLVHFIHWIRRLEVPNDSLNGVWWSSDATYRSGRKLDWVTTNVLLRMLSARGASFKVQEDAYRMTFDRVPNLEHVRLFKHGCVEDSRVLGDLSFIRDVWRNAGQRSPGAGRARSANESPDGGAISRAVMQCIDKWGALCSERLPRSQAARWKALITVNNMRSRSRKRPLPMVRALCVARLIERQIATPAQAARYFGCSARSISARRRRYYAGLFRECFSEESEALLGAP